MAEARIYFDWNAGAPLNAPDRDTFYAGGEHGYLDYPTLSA